MHDQEEDTLAAYGGQIIPALRTLFSAGDHGDAAA